MCNFTFALLNMRVYNIHVHSSHCIPFSSDIIKKKIFLEQLDNFITHYVVVYNSFCVIRVCNTSCSNILCQHIRVNNFVLHIGQKFLMMKQITVIIGRASAATVIKLRFMIHNYRYLVRAINPGGSSLTVVTWATE